MKRTSLLKRGDNAIVVFTYGEDLRIKRDGSGSTGQWVIDKDRAVNRVIIYERTDAGNDIYIAKAKEIKSSRKSGRVSITLSDARYFGTTFLNWLQFAGSRNPVRYWDNRSDTAGTNQSPTKSAQLTPSEIESQHRFAVLASGRGE